MTIWHKILAERLNASLELVFNQFALVNFDYHNTNTFPVNILVVVISDDGRGDNFFDCRSSGQRLPMLADHLYFLPCNLEIRFDITPGVTFIAVHFNLLIFRSLDVFLGHAQCVMRRDPETVASLRELLEDETNELKAVCGLQAQILRFCSRYWPQTCEQPSPAVRKYEPVFHYIREHGDARLTVGDLARVARLRQDVFSRNFTRDLGQSPKEFLQKHILKEISARLLTPHSSVKETAAAMQFSSEFYMSRFFKRHTGLSPREYQRKFRKKE